MATTTTASPQSFLSSYAPRLRTYANSLLIPVIQQTTAVAAPLSRTTKRGTTAINYAEDGYDDYDDDDDDTRRRPTGLRSIRIQDLPQGKQDLSERFGKETFAPVEAQGIWRDWMGKSRITKNDMQNHSQSVLPLTLIPIKIDIDVPAFTPSAALPPPTTYSHVDLTLPIYRNGEQTVPFRIKDNFMWNLYECLTTTDQFAQTMVQDLDLPNRAAIAQKISEQIRTQLEEWAGVALHPLFHTQQTQTANGLISTIKPSGQSTNASATPAVSGSGTPLRNGFTNNESSIPSPEKKSEVPAGISASATAISQDSDEYNPDDMYRCIIKLTINLGNLLYTDKFEWSLLHPAGTAEMFSKQTCADLGLSGEWISAMTCAIYEAVLVLKKKACDDGGLVGGGIIENEALDGQIAGWRYDPEHLADDWEPKIEQLTKEEIEKREIERQREDRRVRRETARYTSNTGMAGGLPQQSENRGGYFDEPTGEERMGRGERRKTKRRFGRSLSPANTPGARGTPEVGGYGGGGALTEAERSNWQCSHCKIWGTSVWAVRDGPNGPKSLCNNCGFLYERDRKLPRWFKDLHKDEPKGSMYR